MTAALEHLLIVDATTAFWSSLGTALLADFGARVIKVEPLPQSASSPPGRDPSHHRLANRNKRSLALDLTSPRGIEVLAELSAMADVFVTDWPPTERKRLACDYPALATIKPDLIYVHASALGPTGPERDSPALDEIAAARTGTMPILPQPDQPPVYAGTGQMYSSVMIALGALIALWHRDQTDQGQEVDVSLLGGNMYGASLDLQAFLAIGGDRFLKSVSRLDAGNPMSGPMYPTADGRWLTITMPDSDRYWPRFAPTVGLDASDPRFDSHDKRCGSGRLELIQVLDEAFRQQPASHWKRAFEELELSGDVIEDYAFSANDPQAIRNKYVVASDGVGKTLGLPIYLSNTPAALDRPAPTAGQDSRDVLSEVLGYPAARVTALAAEKAIA